MKIKFLFLFVIFCQLVFSENLTCSSFTLSEKTRTSFIHGVQQEKLSPYDDYLRLGPKLGTILKQSLPKECLMFLSDIVVKGNPYAVVLENCPITYCPGPTPEKGEHSKTKGFQDEYFLLALINALYCNPWHEKLEKTGEIIHQIVPLKGKEYEASSAGHKVHFGFHTELPHYQRPIDYIILLCIKDDPNAFTEILSVDEFIKGIPEKIIHEMLKPQFEFKTGPSYSCSQSGIYSFLEHDPWGGFFIRFISNFNERVLPLNSKAVEVLDFIKDHIKNIKFEKMALRKGDCLILNNRKIMHARSNFEISSSFEERRWLLRAYAYINWHALMLNN